MEGRSKRRAPTRTKKKTAPRPRGWKAWLFAAIAIVLVVAAALATRDREASSIVQPAAVPPSVADERPQQKTHLYGKDENSLSLDLSEGRGEHKEELVLWRAGTVDVLEEESDGPYFRTAKISSLKRGDRIRMEGGKFGLILENEVMPDRELPAEGESTVIGRSEHVAGVLVDLKTERDFFQVTPDHRFWVAGKGWTDAGKLQAGDPLETQEGEENRVVSLRFRQTSERVYNIETWPDHTFRVGNSGVLVHNGACVVHPEGDFEAAEGAGKGASFNSFTAFKRAVGPAGEGLEWHHIVEQNRTNLARFGPDPIHNTENLMRLDEGIHQDISAYYASKDLSVSTAGIVREWVSRQPFSVQREFGLEQLRKRGITP